MKPAESREETIFETAAELPPERRAAYLQEACGDVTGLRKRIENLLQAHDRGSKFMEEPAAPPSEKTVVLAIPVSEKPGDRIGRYKLLQQIGEGGCGIVYMAEQEEPVRRRVALKVIKQGMDTKSVIARFEAERQALALMDHPNIAKVLDAGATETGRPFFVMELVRGIKITDFCDENKISTEERLKLFVHVCQAVQHAHQKGIIHRDIKPSNILVTINDGFPVPKVIDFGIAKATTQQRLTDKTLFTAFEQFLGTPAYMSPEQAVMTSQDVDTRSDIYSLGVLLYELLTGQTPFDARELINSGLDAMRRTICEKEPPRPSTRLSTMLGVELKTVAARHGAEPPKLIHVIRGDLDWIVMKCIEKERARRYDTVSNLAFDVQRHLHNEPVVARPPSHGYRFQKWVRRNKLAVAAGTAVIIALLAGLTISTWMFIRERRALQRAVKAERDQSRSRDAAEKSQASEAAEKRLAQQNLYDSLVGQATAVRLARRMGYREEVFKLVQQARQLHVPQKDLSELRLAAVAALGDFAGLAPQTFSNFPSNRFIQDATIGPGGKLAAFIMSDGNIQLREMPTGRTVATLESTNSVVDFAFNSKGDKFFSLETLRKGTHSERFAGARLCTWSGEQDGRWGLADNCARPAAFEFLRTATRVYLAVFDSQFKEGEPFSVTDLENPSQSHHFTLGFPFRITGGTLALSRDERFLAVVSTEATGEKKCFLNIVDFQTGQVVNRLAQNCYDNGRLGFSPDSKYISYLSDSGGGLYTFPELRRTGDFKEWFDMDTAFAGDLMALPIIHQNRIRLWNLVRKEDVALLEGLPMTSVVGLAADSSFLLACNDRQARLYSLRTAEKLELPSHANAATGVAFSPNGAAIASVGKDRVLRVCNLATGSEVWSSDALPGPGQCVGYCPEGKLLATGDWQTDLIQVWDARTGKRVLEIKNGREGTMSVQFSPDGRYLFTSSKGSGARIWTVERTNEQSGVELRLFKDRGSPTMGLIAAHDNKTLAFIGAYRNGLGLYLWHFEGDEGPELVSTRPMQGVQSHSFAPDDRRLLWMGPGREIFTKDIANPEDHSHFPTVDTKMMAGAGYANNLCLSPDGAKLAVVSGSALGVNVWDPGTGKLLYALPEAPGSVYWLAWNPDSRRLAVARDNGEIAVWDLGEIEKSLAKLELNQ
jgi:serine/threonine protein kinase/WD40 repeat protein